MIANRRSYLGAFAQRGMRRDESNRSAMPDPLSNRWVATAGGVVLVLVFAVAFIWSAAAGAPKDLPDVALGSPALLHLIRATLATALIGGVGVVLARGLAGRWPLEFSATGLKYADAVQDLTKVEEDLALLQATAESHEQEIQSLRLRLEEQ
jgi:hypothetical protein